MLFTDELCKFTLLLFTTWSSILNTRSLAALVAITQNVFLATSQRPGNSYLWSRHHWRMSLWQLCQTRGPHADESKVLFGPVSFSLSFMYNTITAWLYFCHLKFDIFDAMVFSTCLLCTRLRTGRFSRVHWHLGAKLIYSFLISINVFVPLR